MTTPIVPIWQRPPAWNRSLPREWQDPEAIIGLARKRPSRIRRILVFVFGVGLVVWIFFLINIMTDPRFWAAIAGE